MRQTTPPAPRRPGRPSPPPPAILSAPGETFEGARVLQEVPGEPGGILWQALRDTMLWASVSRRQRAELFAPGAQAKRTAVLARADLPPALEAENGDPCTERRWT